MKIVDTANHLTKTSLYDDQLRLVSISVMAEPGWQLNGHRADCRCVTCRPDIVRLEMP